MFNIYTFSVIGCPELVRPPNTWMKKTSEGAIVGCTEAKDSWRVLCQGHSWVGEVGNCSACELCISFS